MTGVKAGGLDAVESEHFSCGDQPTTENIPDFGRLVTLSPLVWDAQAIHVGVVRDGRKKIVAASEPAPWDGLPVWLCRSFRDSRRNYSLPA